MLSVHAALMNAVEKGHLSEARIAQAVERAHRVFGAAGQGTTDVRTRIEELERCIPSDNQTCMEVMQSAVSVLRGSVPDVRQGRWNILVPDHPRYRLDLCQQLKDLDIVELRYPLNPAAADITAVMDEVKDADCIMLGFRTSVYPGQIELASKLNDRATISKCGLWYIETDLTSVLTYIPNLENVIATFDPSDFAMKSLAEFLLHK
jgi:hypothetical protein